jgi:pantetheine-phosphate adenylyltransferase
MATAVYAGSFDPITNGHVDVVEKALKIFDHVYVVVAVNPEKSKGMFSTEDRVSLCNKTFKGKPVTVRNIYSGFVVDFAHSVGATHLVRGLPTVADFQYEYELYHNNRAINPNIETAFVMCDKDIQQVRSSTVRGLYGLNGWVRSVTPMVPAPVMLELSKRFCVKFEHPPFATDVFDIRPYHNFVHIADMIDILNTYKSILGIENNIQRSYRAAMYHDVVTSSDKEDFSKMTPEEKSEDRAKGLGVSDLILCTDYNKAFEDLSHVQKVFRSVDLSILAAPNAAYDIYADNIQKEYCEYGSCPEEKFVAGRIAFLKGAIAKAKSNELFDISQYISKNEFTSVCPHFCNEKAASNMKRELGVLLTRD